MSPLSKLTARRAGLVLAVMLLSSQPATAAPKDQGPPQDFFALLANDAAVQVLASPVFQARTDGGRKVKIVIGDVINNSDDEGVRVEDLFNEIRNQIVSAGTTRLFAPGELNVDFVIAPELTSSIATDAKGRRQRCFTLNLTLTKPSGEFALAQKAKRCG